MITRSIPCPVGAWRHGWGQCLRYRWVCHCDASEVAGGEQGRVQYVPVAGGHQQWVAGERCYWRQEACVWHLGQYSERGQPDGLDRRDLENPSARLHGQFTSAEGLHVLGRWSSWEKGLSWLLFPPHPFRSAVKSAWRERASCWLIGCWAREITLSPRR